MRRTLALAALSTLLLATAVEAYSGSTSGNDGYGALGEWPPSVASRPPGINPGITTAHR